MGHTAVSANEASSVTLYIDLATWSQREPLFMTNAQNAVLLIVKLRFSVNLLLQFLKFILL